MMVEKSKLKEGSENEYEKYFEDEILNSMVPIWRKNKSEITSEEYNHYYRERFFDFNDPAAVIHTKAEGQISYDALRRIFNNPATRFTNDEILAVFARKGG